MDPLEQLREWDYTVEAARDGLLYIEGHGLAVFVSSDDGAALMALADPEAHAARVDFELPPPTEPPGAAT
ncbi:MAG TPA: hypothetical protein VKB59_17355 [Micromonosporaceae bacterium]|nr:hypothetical protein [Micromonosporaceae bacterium]